MPCPTVVGASAIGLGTAGEMIEDVVVVGRLVPVPVPVVSGTEELS